MSTVHESVHPGVRHAGNAGSDHHAGAERNLPRLATSMTFSRMVRENLRAMPNRKQLEWLFPPLCDRKDQAALTDTERERYICAYNMINADGTLGQLVDIHGGMHMQHTNQRLLPWHRAFLLLFEAALHNYHPDVCVPYWDWTDDQSFPDWLEGITPTVNTSGGTIQVVRAPGTNSQLSSIVSGTAAALAETTYDAFSAPINGIHGGVHIWVGGTMSDASVSPADPVFWLHHANLDRLWWQWYNSPAGNHQNPPLAGADAVMDPWTYSEVDLRDIGALGYAYA
jgi:tyrosinase